MKAPTQLSLRQCRATWYTRTDWRRKFLIRVVPYYLLDTSHKQLQWTRMMRNAYLSSRSQYMITPLIFQVELAAHSINHSSRRESKLKASNWIKIRSTSRFLTRHSLEPKQTVVRLNQIHIAMTPCQLLQNCLKRRKISNNSWRTIKLSIRAVTKLTSMKVKTRHPLV